MHSGEKYRCKLCGYAAKFATNAPRAEATSKLKNNAKAINDVRMYSAMSHKKVASQKLDDTHCAFLGCDVGRPRYSRDGQHDSAHGGIHIPEAGPENSSGSEDWIDNEFAVAIFDEQK